MSKHVLHGQIYLAKNRAAQPHLNAEELGDILIALPDEEQQLEIINYLDDKLDVLNRQESKIQSVIARLQEYRSTLITNAVTGKIDVRGWPHD